MRNCNCISTKSDGGSLSATLVKMRGSRVANGIKNSAAVKSDVAVNWFLLGFIPDFSKILIKLELTSFVLSKSVAKCPLL